MMRLVATVAIALLTSVAAACAAAPPTTPSASPLPALEATASPNPWRPLAVLRPPAGPIMDGLAQGTLVITDECVFVEDVTGARELVVWNLAPDLWAWDATTREVVSRWGSRRYGDGDEIRLGGGGRMGRDGLSIEQILREQEWLSPPDPSCVTRRVFFASGEVSDPER